ncbi:ABC transporter permease [Bacillus sp. JJ722]|uniref:ABC transporter permease n=1 Tax=Bacillus sp. JJ722 TaxID=3122973 RepID=UPI002FFDF7C4
MSKQSIWKKGAPFFLLLFLLIIWEMITVVLKVEPWLLPSPSAILKEGIADFDRVFEQLGATVQLAVIGLIIGSLIGIILAAVLHVFPKVKDAVYPLLILSQNVPIIVLAPLLVIWFGFGILPKIIVIALVCFFPVAVAALDGLRQTPFELKHYFHMMGASKKELFWKLELPHALPFLFSGLKISATYSVMGAVISEWLGAKEGIGVYMTLASSSFRTDRVFVAIFIIMVLSLLFFSCITLLERYFVSWKRKENNNYDTRNE